MRLLIYKINPLQSKLVFNNQNKLICSGSMRSRKFRITQIHMHIIGRFAVPPHRDLLQFGSVCFEALHVGESAGQFLLEQWRVVVPVRDFYFVQDYHASSSSLSIGQRYFVPSGAVRSSHFRAIISSSHSSAYLAVATRAKANSARIISAINPIISIGFIVSVV